MDPASAYIPRRITVHLGYPNEPAPDVTVPFVDYIKNVASSEIYPTWNENALKANILSQISFALNRVYTEYYRSRGFGFEITNSTAIDQAYVHGRSIFDNISRLVDDMFNDYLRRRGFREPLAAKYCNGTSVTCSGLSQWGSQELAAQGYDYMSILYSYYGRNIEIVYDAPESGLQNSYPGTPLRLGSRGPAVLQMQVSLNRISQSYPAIPKISPADGLYGPGTEETVRRFQSVFGLTADGIVGKATWYEIVRLYVGLQKLGELDSMGQTFDKINWTAPEVLAEGDKGDKVRQLQYMLAVTAEFDPEIRPVPVTGSFGPLTRQSVLSFQKLAGLPETGFVGAVTWNALYDKYRGIARNAGYRESTGTEGKNPGAVQTLRTVGEKPPAGRWSLSGGLLQNPGYTLRRGMRDQGRQTA